MRQRHFDLPLEAGDWLVLSDSLRTVRNFLPGSNVFRDVPIRDLEIALVANGRVVRYMMISGSVDAGGATRSIDEPCADSQPVFHKNSYGTRLWIQKCLTVSQVAVFQSQRASVNSYLGYFSEKRIKFDLRGVASTYTRYDDYRYLRIQDVYFPASYGGVFELAASGGNAVWTPADYAQDPHKKAFVDAVVKHGEYLASVYDKVFAQTPGLSLVNSLALPGTANATLIPLSTPGVAVDVPRAALIERPISPSPVTQPSSGGPVQTATRVTSNPLDSAKKTSPNEVWVSFNPSVTVQERQFCRIVDNFRTEHALAQASRNQIRVNETFKTFSQSLNALLPDGKFQGWIMRTVWVAQATDGSAEVLLELPCNVYVGSNACDANPRNFYGTAPEGSRIYTELAKMTVGDFALTSGQFVFTDQTVFDRSRSVASFKMMKSASHCRAPEMPADSDFFGLSLDVISTIK